MILDYMLVGFWKVTFDATGQEIRNYHTADTHCFKKTVNFIIIGCYSIYIRTWDVAVLMQVTAELKSMKREFIIAMFATRGVLSSFFLQN